MSGPVPIEPGTRVKVKTTESGESYFEGTFMGNYDAYGCEFVVFDLGEGEPFHYAVDTLVWMQPLAAAEVKGLRKRQR